MALQGHTVTGNRRACATSIDVGRAEALLRQAGLAKGMRVVDLGCGGGDAALAAGRIVGASGMVIGIDSCAGDIDRAERRATEAGLCYWVRFVRADPMTFLPDQTVDAVISRRASLCGSHAPARSRRLAALLGPDGILVAWDAEQDTPPRLERRLAPALSRHPGSTARGLRLNRRTAIQAGLAGAAAMTFRSKAMADSRRPPPAIEELLDYNPERLAQASVDFGYLIQRRPEAEFRPRRPAEVATLVQWARASGKKVVARGRGHSIYGRASVENAIVARMDSLNTVDEVLSDRITVDAGATWGNVLHATLPHSLTPPVLPDYLELSVGGVLAVGGVSGGTSRHGTVTDNVLDIQVVSGEGQEFTCSRERNCKLFDAVLAGLAQTAIVTRATLRLVEAPQRVRRYQLAYADLGALTADQIRVLSERRFDHLQGAIVPEKSGAWKFQLNGIVLQDRSELRDDAKFLAALSDRRDAAAIIDMSYDEYTGGFAKLEAALRESGQWFKPHPWLLTFLPGSTAERLASLVMDQLGANDLGPFGQLSYYPFATNAIHTPLLRVPDEPIAFVLNVIRFPSTDDKHTIEQMVAVNRAIYENARDAGGVLYPVSALPMTAEDWKQHFGGQWTLLRDSKQRLNPVGVIASGYDIF